MSDGSRRNEDSLPVFDAPDPVEIDDPGAAPRASRRGLGPGRGAGAAAAFLVILVAGIAVGGVINDPGPIQSPTPPGTDAVCQPQRAADVPPLTLAAPEFNEQALGLFGVAYTSLEPAPSVPAWLGPPPADALKIAPSASLELISRPLACMTGVRVWVHQTDTLSSGGDGDELANMTVRGSRATLALNGAPDGDWVLRVEAHYAGQDQGQSAELVTRWFFRVVVAEGFVATPTPGTPAPPTPAVTPTTPCSPGPASADIQVLAAAGAELPVTGGTAPFSGTSPAEAPTLPIGLGDHVQIWTADFTCAVSWTIRLIDPSSLGGNTVEFQRNDNDDPSFASQDEWDVAVNGTALLLAHLHFAGGPTIDRTWLLESQPFEIPRAFLVGLDGTRVEMSPGCGLSLSLVNGYQSSDGCAGTGVSFGPRGDQVRAGTPISFEIPGWEIRSWSAVCGSLSVEGADAFTQTDGCDLGGGTSDTGGPLPDPAAFLLPAIDTIVVIQADAVSPGGDEFSVPYYVHVVAR